MEVITYNQYKQQKDIWRLILTTLLEPFLFHPFVVWSANQRAGCILWTLSYEIVVIYCNVNKKSSALNFVYYIYNYKNSDRGLGYREKMRSGESTQLIFRSRCFTCFILIVWDLQSVYLLLFWCLSYVFPVKRTEQRLNLKMYLVSRIKVRPIEVVERGM